MGFALNNWPVREREREKTSLHCWEAKTEKWPILQLLWGHRFIMCVQCITQQDFDPLTGSSKTSVIQTVRTNNYSVSG